MFLVYAYKSLEVQLLCHAKHSVEIKKVLKKSHLYKLGDLYKVTFFYRSPNYPWRSISKSFLDALAWASIDVAAFVNI